MFDDRPDLKELHKKSFERFYDALKELPPEYLAAEIRRAYASIHLAECALQEFGYKVEHRIEMPPQDSRLPKRDMVKVSITKTTVERL